MRTGPAIILAMLCGCMGLLLWAGCSEEKPADIDATAPSVAIVHPFSYDREGAEVRDSTDIIIHASDNDAVADVQIFYHVQGDTTMNLIALLTEPDSTGSYTSHWKTAGILNGSDCVLRAMATDRAGNIAASDEVRVLVINEGDIGPPHANFQATPSEGTILTEFCFDATITTDDLADPVDLLVQWDFEGDGIWDHVLADQMNVNDLVCHRYPVPDTYTVALEVYNRYYSIPLNIPGLRTRRLIVKPAFGDPRPPEGQELVRVDPGDYPVAAISCAPSDSCDIFDQDETVDDTLMVRISNSIYIDKYEVTNQLYIDYLNAASDSNFIYYEFENAEVWQQSNDRCLLRLGDGYTRVKFQFADSSFWADELYYDHPVTGVTWYGAQEYAAFYGLRLPTEVEWEVAARKMRMSSLHLYPWDDFTEVDSTYTNYYRSDDPYEVERIPTSPVGSFNGAPLGGVLTKDAVGPCGTYDQAGNVAEWCSDWFDANIYDELLNDPGIPINPQGPDLGTDRVLRGGSWAQFKDQLRVTNRQGADPLTTAPWIGFRTAYTIY